MLIAMDHGNKQCKLVRSAPFISGLTESEVRPFGPDVLKYKEKYYQISGQRIPYRRDKTEDDRFFILTLFGIANEIEAAGAYAPGIMRVQLAVGLPPAHYGAQHEKFTQYFFRRGVVSFTYRGKPYSISIDDVACYPQSYAAAVSMLQTLTAVWWWTSGATPWTTSASKRDGAIWRPATLWRMGSSCSTTRSSPRFGRPRTSS